MARSDDVTSTEKLLKVIRNKKEMTPAPSGAPEPRSPKSGALKPPLTFAALRPKATRVGIDIGHDYLRLVKTAESGGKWRLIARRRLPIPSRTATNSQDFSTFLQQSLASFCGSARQSNLWVIMSSENVDVRHVRIPKVPRKQMANAAYWTAKKESLFDEKEMIFDFELQGEVVDQGIPKLVTMVYTAPRREIEELKGVFSRIGWPLTGISIGPFAMQNFFRSGWMLSREGAVAGLFIGNDYSHIDIYCGGDIVMTRRIKVGINSMVEAMMERLNDLQKGQGAPALTLEQGRKIVNSLSPDSPPLVVSDAGFGLPKEDVFEMIQPALERLVRQVEKTFEYYVNTGGGEQIGTILFSSAMNIYRPIVDYIGDQLGVEIAVLDPLSEQAPVPCPDVNDSKLISERVAFAPALGVALSDNVYTPNLMCTYKDKEKAASVTLINKSIFAVFFALALICTGVFVYQSLAISDKKTELAKLTAQLTQLGPSVDRNQLQQMVAKVNQRRQLSKVLAERYLGMVLISELTALTPSNIRFLNLKINLGPANASAPKPPPPLATTAAAPAKAKIEDVTVEGLVFGERQALESSLAAYAVLLETSPLIRQVIIQKNTVEPYLKSEALRFIINMKVEEQVHG